MRRKTYYTGFCYSSQWLDSRKYKRCWHSVLVF